MQESKTKIENFRDLVNRTVSRYPQNIAYKSKRSPEDTQYIEITYAQVQKEMKELSTALINMGLSGKRIAVIGNNRYEWCVSYLAITTGNMVVVPLDKALPNNEIKSLILRSQADAIIFEDKYTEVIKEISNKKECQLQYLICMDNTNQEGITTYQTLLKQGEKLLKEGDNQYNQIKINNEEMAVMLFTSGTTNIAKAVMLSQKNICYNVEAFEHHVLLYPNDTLLSFLPLHHTFECTITFLYGFYSGVTVAFADGLKYIQKNLKEYEVTVFVAVPLMLEIMYKRIQKAIADQGKTRLIKIMTGFSRFLFKCHIDVRRKLFKPVLTQLGGKLRLILYGAASMDKETILGYDNLGIALAQGYGLTETSPVICAETDKKKKPGSVGIPLYNIEVKIENPDSQGVGELMAKGPNIMLGYYENEEATKEVLEDGWIHTGDYAYRDEQGFIYITGRKSDIIILRNGKNIYPYELEFLINKIPYVSESMVFARNKDKVDTLLGAKIVYDEELIKERLGEKTQEEYKQEVWNKVKEINQTLPVYKHIKEIILTTEPLIKTTTQKVKRFQEMKKIESM